MELKRSKTGRRKYDADFKKEVLKMVELGRSVTEISQSVGIGSNLIYTWVRRSKALSADTKFSTSVGNLDEEKLSLHKRIKELEMERDILKKALSIFSRPM